MVIRAGTVVRLTAEGAKTFPAQAGMSGELIGYNSPTQARVLFHGTGTPIVLHRDYLEPAVKDQRRRSAVTQRNEEILARRKLIRAAFDIVRHDPKEKTTSSMLARALGGSLPVTETILETARIIIRTGAHHV